MRYRTKAGDTWDGITYLIYGDKRRVVDLMRANAQYLIYYRLPAGLELVVPV